MILCSYTRNLEPDIEVPTLDSRSMRSPLFLRFKAYARREVSQPRLGWAQQHDGCFECSIFSAEDTYLAPKSMQNNSPNPEK